MDKALDKKVAVFLAGCGHLDGAEISEAVMTNLALRLSGFKTEFFSLAKPQRDVMNHFKSQPDVGANRVAIDEAARIARGKIKPLESFHSNDFAAIAIPGGFGVAKNFCDFALKGVQAQVEGEMERILSGALKAKMPIMAVCIAPAVVGLVGTKLGMKLKLSLGDTTFESSQELAKLGHEMHNCAETTCFVDSKNKVICTPAFMFGDTSVDKIWPGIQEAVLKLRSWI